MKGLIAGVLCALFSAAITDESDWAEGTHLSGKIKRTPVERYYNREVFLEHLAPEIYNSLVAFRQAGEDICSGALVSLTKILTVSLCGFLLTDQFEGVTVVLGVGHQKDGLACRGIINIHFQYDIHIALITIDQPAPLSTFISVCPLPMYGPEEYTGAISVRLKEKSTMLVDYLRVICTADNIIYANLSDFADIFNTDNLNSVRYIGGFLVQEKRLLGMLKKLGKINSDENGSNQPSYAVYINIFRIASILRRRIHL